MLPIFRQLIRCVDQHIHTIVIDTLATWVGHFIQACQAVEFLVCFRRSPSLSRVRSRHEVSSKWPIDNFQAGFVHFRVFDFDEHIEFVPAMLLRMKHISF
jgi:hypothetical protein